MSTRPQRPQRKSKPRSFRLRPDRVPERLVLNAIMTYLTMHPQVSMVERVNVGLLKNPRNPNAWVGWSVRDVNGDPVRGKVDIQAVIRDTGRALLVECKSPDGAKLTPEQEAYRDAARAAGCIWAVVSSVDEMVLCLRMNGV